MGLTLRRHGAALALATFFASQCGRTKQCGGLAANRCVLEPDRYRGHCRRINKRDHRSGHQRSPSQSLPDILAQQVGVQVMHVTGSPNGNGDMVDLRGFGAFAQSNVLVLVNGRRYQDFDLQGFDFSQIPLNSIERIEITRGMSGTVLYGDGAIGGVINIVTKTASGAPFSGRVEGAVGSYGFGEGRVSAGATSGPWSTAIYANAATSSGYRQNSQLSQQNAVGNLSYRSPEGTGYLNIIADSQRQNLPGTLQNLPLVYPITLDTPRASVTPFDWATQTGLRCYGRIHAHVGFRRRSHCRRWRASEVPAESVLQLLQQSVLFI